MEFTVLEDFDDPELESSYCRGMTYTLRDFSEYDTTGWPPAKVVAVANRCGLLAKKLPQWIAEGKAALGGLRANVRGG